MSWISWLFAAIARQAPLQNTPPISPLENKERIRELVEDQIEYHRNREHESHSAQARLEKLASLAFLGVTVAVLLKLFLELMHTDLTFVVVLSMLAIVLPAVSAAFFALRSYAELELLAEQSNYMIHKLKSAARRIEALKPERVLVSQELGHDAATIAGWMLQDLEGWGRLFRGKLPEA